jgi:hypothetical protein
MKLKPRLNQQETPMSLYERVDRDVSPKPREKFEFLLVYVVCFVAMLLPMAIRRLGRRTEGDGEGSGRSVFGEARTMAANCAASSFMGM